MTYKESSTIELKKVFIDKIKHKIIPFLNSEGGVVYVGISDDGTVVGIDKERQDEYDSILSSWIRDAFYPNTSNLIKFFFNQDDVMEIYVSRGTEKPYYLVSKGPVPSGVFIRIGRSSRSATQDEILKMLVESPGFSFESSTSPNQELNFVQFGLFANEAKLDVNAAKYLTLGLKNNAKEYSNLGLLVRD